MSPRRNNGATGGPLAGGDQPPALAASLAQGEEAEKKPLSFNAIDGVDEKELTDKTSRVPGNDWINDAVGVPMYQLNGSLNGWTLRSGRSFGVTRWYFHKRVAVDLPRNAGDMAIIAEKRALLRERGIVYVVIALGETITADDLVARIEAEKKAMSEQGKELVAA